MRIVLLFCSLFFVIAAIAGERQAPYVVLHYTDADGLPQNSVKFITRDNEGFMWLATEDGMVRFDGRQFLVFNSNIGLQNSRIQRIFPGLQGRSLMARTVKGEQIAIRKGKAVLEPRTSDFSYIFSNDTTRTFPVLGFWRFLRDIEAYHYLVPVGPDSYFKITKDTIRYIENGAESYRLHYSGIKPEKFFVQDKHLCYIDRNGCFLLFDSRGVHTLRMQGDQAGLQPSPGAGRKRDIFWNFAAGQQFVYTNKICFSIRLVNDSIIQFTRVLEGFDMVENGIVAVYHDSINQRTFLGSLTKGLFICTAKQFRVLKSRNEGEEVFYGQALFGTDSIVTPGGNIFSRQNRPGKLSLPDSVWTNDKYSMTRDNHGNYWYKSCRRLVKLNKGLTNVEWTGGINYNSDDQINVIYTGNTGRLWIGTQFSGLYYLETSLAHPDIRPFLPDLKDISYIQEEADVLWVGTMKGLYRVSLSSRKVDTIPGLEKNYIRSLHIPHSREIWITTYSNGIFLYRNGKLTRLPLDPKEYIATAHCIIADGKGFLWVTTNKGLFRLSYQDALAFTDRKRKDLFYQYYGREQGFNTNEFNGGCQPCAVRLPNGDISLPSLDGLVYFSPGSIRCELPDKRIFIDAAELDTKGIDVDSSISIPGNFRHLRLHVSTPYFGDHNNLRLYYYLSGEDIDGPVLWLEVSENKSIEFSSLHSGKYILKIIKMGSLGADITTERILVINVQKTFYETAWFKILVICLLLLLAFMFFRIRMEREKRKNFILEGEVEKRTGELMEVLANFQKSEEQLRTQGFIQQRLTAAMSHDLKTPLQYIMHILSEGDRHKKELAPDEIAVVYESLYSMFHLVENLISYMKSLYTSDDSSLEVTDLFLLLEEKASIFRRVAAAKHVTIVNATGPGFPVLVNRQLLAIIIHNLLDNAVKYTRKGSILLKASSEGKWCHIQFIDTGIGMPPEVITWVNRYRKGMPVTEQKPPSYDGIGLMIVMELLQLIDGIISVVPNDDGGTVINITMTIIE